MSALRSARSIRARFDHDGYVVVRNVIPHAVLEGLRTRVAAAVEDHARRLHSEGAIIDLCESAPFARRLAALYEQTDRERPRKWFRCLFSPELHAVVTAPRLLDALEDLLGHDVVFHGDHQLVTKLPDSTRTAFPWHQDSQYYGRESVGARVLTVWVPLVEVAPANGCLKVIPGSHRWGMLPWARDESLNVRIPIDVEARGEAVALPMAPGDAVILTNLTLHASDLNTTDEVRWTIDLGFSSLHSDTEDPAVRAAEAFIHNGLRATGRTPLLVIGDGQRAPESWATWLDRRYGRTAPVWTDV